MNRASRLFSKVRQTKRIKMKAKDIRNKFGDNYVVDDYTFIMGIDLRFTTHFAKRFKNLRVLETCTGAGFTTISLARTAKHVSTVEIEKSHQIQAVSNIEKAGLLILQRHFFCRLLRIDAI
jgi:tRNA1(Val) A37 N6-methylase TrmN6